MQPTISKSPELGRALEQAPNGPVFITDADGQITHVVVSAKAYQGLQALLSEEPFDIRETYEAQSQAFAAIWDDPELDEYNDYDAHRAP
jgi:hypothetical protein